MMFRIFRGMPCEFLGPVSLALYWVLLFNLLVTEYETFAAAGETKAARPGYEYAFPRDHGAHEAFLLEWWYFTGHLFTSNDRRFGYELTFFRRSVDDSRVVDHPSVWAIRQVYLAHFAITDAENQTFRHAERLSRAGLGKAGAQTGRLEVWIDHWSVKALDAGHRSMRLRAAEEGMEIDLVLTSLKIPAIHGQDGISRKGVETGQASHYFSLSRLETKGKIVMNGERLEVTGLSWMDHEFGSGALGKNQVGWDWFSLQLDKSLEVMVYMLRHDDGSHDPMSSGTLIFPDGVTRHLKLEDIILRAGSEWHSRKSGARYPSSWQMDIPSADLSVRIQPIQADQELRTSKGSRVNYWEGAVDVQGQYEKSPIKGLGYVELTGYDSPLDMRGQ